MYYYRALKRVAVKYRGVEQLVARRAHNPKVVGSSPPSATKKGSRHTPTAIFFGMMLPFRADYVTNANYVANANDVCFANFGGGIT